ncbi:TIGR04283 family arsenosugar biosynthesis glycosyltransferase [Mesobacterium sp. TK19101]|uniref:TIGR04283 family arsenosugar biosynthesis glycosyltransferase n=1 Tax=Mesobacterium hydrothermale TaxID=3111907 RepID=A0ABU6HHA9_9RHOB|nr:TIGR04283 family arsenosugar biosynthesis glycosyltransferase [Mesobacterium sp. TK19101]MEC3861174.1 TIGR04283 family arsenosugar biosynthesis glycosyltransferase [Mesobacterium sp. TK19101]
MRAPISVIIPTLNAANGLPGCLAALMPGLEAGVIRELVISDGGSQDATLRIAEEVGARVVTGAPGRGGQLRRGAAQATGPWLLFLHADTRLSPDWVDAVAPVLDGQGAWAFRLRFDAPGLAPRWVAGWANLRSRVFGLPYGDQGLLVPRALYDRVGGFPDQPLMEDVAIARCLRGRIGLLPGLAVTEADRYRRNGWLRQGARNLWRLIRYLAGVPAERLQRGYDR